MEMFCDHLLEQVLGLLVVGQEEHTDKLLRRALFQNHDTLFPTNIEQLHSLFAFTVHDFSLPVDLDVHVSSSRAPTRTVW